MHRLVWIMWCLPLLANGQVSDLQQSAAKGDAKAMLELSEKYLFGFGVAENEDSAAYWLNTALATGDPEAAYLIGVLKTGMDLSASDFKEGITLLEQAAEKELPSAYWTLSEIYRTIGSGSTDRYYDLTKALDLAEKAAELGIVEAMRYSGNAYMAGSGTEPNDSIGIVWLEKAGFKDDVESQLALGNHYISRTSPQPFVALTWYRAVNDNRRANADQRSLAKIGVHEVDHMLREVQNHAFRASGLPEAFQYQIRK